MKLISAHDISIEYNNRTILKNFSLDFCPGAYLLSGGNGSGKSSLLRIISGIARPAAGKMEYLFEGELNKNRCYLPDIPKFFPFMKVADFIDLISSIREVSSAKYLLRYEDKFALGYLLRKKMSDLSLGQLKKVFCVVSLMDEVAVWVLDEPLNGLDQETRGIVIDAINVHSEKNLVILAEHADGIQNRLTRCTRISL